MDIERTNEMYRSRLFRMQVEELLKRLNVKSTPEVETFLHKLGDCIKQLPSTAVKQADVKAFEAEGLSYSRGNRCDAFP